MASLNMASINTLFRKGYLLAGVIMAANMFVVNEVKATSTTNFMNFQPQTYLNSSQNGDLNTAPNIGTGEKGPDIHAAQTKGNIFDSLLFGFLSWEGRINFFVGFFFSAANNYLKWWDYNPGGYCNLRIGCLGLRSKRLLNGMLQFEGNLNLIKGTLWLIPGIFELIRCVKGQDDPRSTAGLIMLKILEKVKGNEPKFGFFFSIFFLVQGFVSIPLTLHFSKFSISISLDSFIWGITGMILAKEVASGMPIEGAEKNNEENQIEINNENENNNNTEDKIKDESDNKGEKGDASN